MKPAETETMLSEHLIHFVSINWTIIGFIAFYFRSVLFHLILMASTKLMSDGDVSRYAKMSICLKSLPYQKGKDFPDQTLAP
jgi:hypothetical protein